MKKIVRISIPMKHFSIIEDFLKTDEITDFGNTCFISKQNWEFIAISGFANCAILVERSSPAKEGDFIAGLDFADGELWLRLDGSISVNDVLSLNVPVHIVAGAKSLPLRDFVEKLLACSPF